MRRRWAPRLHLARAISDVGETPVRISWSWWGRPAGPFMENAREAVWPIRHDAVDAPVQQAVHVVRLIDSPDVDGEVLCMGFGDESGGNDPPTAVRLRQLKRGDSRGVQPGQMETMENKEAAELTLRRADRAWIVGEFRPVVIVCSGDQRGGE